MPQKKHLDPKYSCWISANAGTGKTKIVIDRILVLLLNDVPPKNILAITFTNSAADEMKQRINELVEKLIKFEPTELRSYLEEFLETTISPEQLTKYKIILDNLEQQMGELKLQTVHSFCQSLLQEFTIESGVKPGFEIIDANSAKLILDEAREQIFEDPNISGILDDLMSRYQYDYIANILDNIVSNRTKILYILSQYNSFSDYIDRTYDFLGIEQLEDYQSQIFKNLFNQIDTNFLIILITAIEEYGSKKDLGKLPLLSDLQKKLESSDSNYECFLLFQKIFCKKDTEFLKSPFTKKVVSQIFDYDNIINNFEKDYKEVLNIYHKYELAHLSINILLIAQFFLESYEEIKQKHNFLDYEDLILKSISLLKSYSYKDFILLKLDYNIIHLLVDEAQDVSPWQWEIIKLLLEDFFATTKQDKSFFIVGDEKQSIYSFQGANHQLFNNIKNEFSAQLAHKDETLHQINLNTSYRSGIPILALVDKLANHQNIKSSLTTDENNSIIHNCFRNKIRSKLVLWPESTPQKPEYTITPWTLPTEIVKKISPYDEIAQNITGFIKDLLDKDTVPSDILILSRKRSHFYKTIIRSLNQANIQVESDLKIQMLDYVLIMDLVSILKFTLFPDDSLNLAALLKSPLFNFSEEKLFDLCHNREDKTSLYEALQKNKKYLNYYDELENINSFTAILGIEEFYLYILEKYDLRDKYCKIYGRQAETLINLFIQTIQNFEKHNDNYLEFLEYLLRSNISAQNEITNNIESIKILSIHASKGLQAPIVILATETYGKNSFKKDVFNFDYENHLIFCTLTTTPKEYEAYFEDFYQNQISEELRLLYVALTRAKDELHVFSFRNTETSSDWYSLIKNVAEEMPEFKTDENECLVYGVNGDSKIIANKNANLTTESAFILDDNHVVKDNSFSTISQPVTNPNTKDQYYAKIGKIYHELFYFLSQTEDIITDNHINQFLQKYYKDIDNHDLKEICTRTSEIYHNQKFKELFFSANGYSELALCAKIDNKIISGKIDRIAKVDNQLHIIDYKLFYNSNMLPTYKSQLNLYEKLVSKNFPNKKTRKFLFFTREALELLEV